MRLIWILFNSQQEKKIPFPKFQTVALNSSMSKDDIVTDGKKAENVAFYRCAKRKSAKTTYRFITWALCCWLVTTIPLTQLSTFSKPFSGRFCFLLPWKHTSLRLIYTAHRNFFSKKDLTKRGKQSSTMDVQKIQRSPIISH